MTLSTKTVLGFASEQDAARANALIGEMPGFEDCNLLSTGSMVARAAGTIISAGELTASATYWRAA